jgi:hypothetical protein
MASKHQWSFSTVGGIKRVNLESGSDLLHLEELDQKLWTALSCPADDLEIDTKTLELIDLDNDGKIKVPEIIAAVRWMLSVIKNPDGLLLESKVFPLSAINTDNPEGQLLLSSARVVLKSLGKEGEEVLSVEETADIKKIYSSSRFNGDGIVSEDSVDTDAQRILLAEIISCVGSLEDRGGKQGIDIQAMQLFMEECTKFLTWHRSLQDNPAVFVLGSQTKIAYEIITKLRAKVDDYFIRCNFASFDADITPALNLSVATVEQIGGKDLATVLDEISVYPIAKVSPAKNLPLFQGVNPAWADALSSFRSMVVEPMLGPRTELTEAEWKKILSNFDAYKASLELKEGVKVEVLGVERIESILAGREIQEIKELVEKDLAMAEEVNNIIKVDQLVRYYRDLYTLLKNFVTFFDFYAPSKRAIFQAGTLFIDQRSCDLCIKVNDFQKHQEMVPLSGMFLMYCDCKSRAGNDKMMIVAALTNGDIDNLVVGRNALFYDRDGKDWDATIVKIIDNPISIRQAFWSPYRKVSRFIEKQVNKFAAAEDEKVTSSATKTVEELPTKIVEQPAAAKPAPQPFDIGKFVGIFAAISLALGAIGTAIASIIAGFMALVWWKMPLAIMGIVLLISGPAMIMAFLKLRKRNLAPILDANGWAINANVIINIPFGNTLTHLAALPKGAKINLDDPFTHKKRPIIPIIIALCILTGVVFYFLWKFGYMHLGFFGL